MARQQQQPLDPVAARKIKPKKVKWLWRERIPIGMISIVAGKPDQGKGLFATHLAAHVSNQGKNVLYSAQEDDAGMMTRPRLEAAGADLDRVFLDRFGIPTQFDELFDYIEGEDVKLIIVDPIAAHLRGVSRHSDNIREVLNPLSAMCERTGCSVVMIEHALKRIPKGSHPIGAIGGSGSGLPAASRMAYVFGVDPDDADRRLLCPVKSNLREWPQAFAFQTDVTEFDIVGEMVSLIPEGECEYDPMKFLSIAGDGKPGRAPDKRAAASEWLTQYLAAALKPVKAGDVLEDAKQYAHTAKTVRRAADDMGVVRNPPGGGRNCTWALSKELVDVLGVKGYQHGGD